MRTMKEQNYKNHRQYLLGYHGITFLLIFILLIASIYNLYIGYKTRYEFRAALMFFITSLILVSFFWYLRVFPNRAQDRAIRAEENLRHFALTGKLLNPALSLSQIIALRFAPDEELVELSNKAAAENLSPDNIKKEIRNWRADHHRA